MLDGGKLSTKVSRLHLLLHKGGLDTHRHKRESNQNLSAGLLFNAKGEMYQLYHGKSKLHSTRWCLSALYLINTFCWIFIVLTRWNNSSRIDTRTHSDSDPTSLCSYFLMLHSIANTNLTVCGVAKPTIYYRTRCKNANHYITDRFFNIWNVKRIGT